ncbi:hypothetical protein TrLO_g6915 [Triparma laevis f. longispina]|uniref:Plus3 domain-containing protein n=1 Tax=Triparma laevis f. longispina TaxID=1714387 RepID=A0A9W7F2Y4_9STRA|nr:hypothetical protein TrLO_g6915 [Triparma laevis f. longispina]
MPPKRKLAASSYASTKRSKKSVTPALDFGTDSSDSDSDDDLSDSDDEEEYNPEELILNADDANYLEGLGEVEREAILAERYEKRQEEREQEKAVKEQKRLAKQQSSKSKKKAPKKKIVMSESEDEDEDEEEDEEVVEEEAHVEEEDSDDSDDDNQNTSEPMEEDLSVDVTFEEMLSSKVILKRNKLATWAFKESENFFKIATLGCYVRIGIGNDPQTKKPCYRICKIVGFDVTGAYDMKAERFAHKVMTDLKLVLEIGNDKKAFRMTQISNEAMTEDDYKLWTQRLKLQRIPAPTFKEIKRLAKRLDKHLTSYVASSDEIKENLVKKEKLNPNSIRNLPLKIEAKNKDIIKHSDTIEEMRTKLNKLKRENPRIDIDDLDLQEDEEEEEEEGASALKEAKKILKEKAAAEEQCETAKKDLAKLEKANAKRTEEHGKDVKVKGWSFINAKARQNNKAADYNTFKEKKEMEKKQGGKKEEYNPFARRPNKPKMLWAVGNEKKGEKMKGYGEIEEKKDGEDGEGGDGLEDDHQGSQGEIAALSHQFSLNVDDVEAEEINKKDEKAKESDVARERKGMSLKDYLKMKRAKA